MTRSMTGFARAEAQYPWGRLTWELRSVNHRYLDLVLKMPEDMRAIENDLRQRASKVLRRGKVEAGLRLSRDGAADQPISMDSARLEQLRVALEGVRQTLGEAAAPDPVRVLSWPGVVKADAEDLAPLHAAVREQFEVALEELTQMREREGRGLAEHILTRCEGIEKHAAAVKELMPRVQSQWLEKLRARCADLGAEVEPGRLEQEAVVAAQRLDVDEELSRLASHIGEVRKTLKRSEAVGRRLDFLMQELNREANTLSSKSQDADTTLEAVEMKVLIEQMREQVQNIE